MSQRNHRRPSVELLGILAVYLPPLVLVVVAWQRRWVAEDAFIHFRVVENLLDGHGLVFNVGERVEASTSPLWVLALALIRLPGRVGVETAAVAAGAVCSGLGLLLGARAARFLWQRERPGAPVVPLGALIVLGVPPMWDFATSGLESGLVFGWLGASFLLLARAVHTAGGSPTNESGGTIRHAGALVIGLGPLIRPDLALFSAAFLAVLLGARREEHSAGERVKLAALAVALPAAYQFFRMGYFAAIVPNTALAKEASAARWGQGWSYLTDLVSTYRLWFPVLTAAAVLGGAVRRWLADGRNDRVLVALAPVAAGVAHALYVVRVGGDFMHGRLLLPALFGVLLPITVVVVETRLQPVATVLVAGWVVVGAIQPAGSAGDPGGGIGDERKFYLRYSGRAHPVQATDYARTALFRDGIDSRRWAEERRRVLAWRRDPAAPVYGSLPLRDQVSGDVVFAAGNIGISGFVAGDRVHVVDFAGLSDPIVARFRLEGRGRPGHEKNLDLSWAIARFADPAAPPPAGFGPRVDAARAALGCGPLADLLSATTDPLTPARFLGNIGSALRFHTLRIDRDPIQAEGELCQAPRSSR